MNFKINLILLVKLFFLYHPWGGGGGKGVMREASHGVFFA